MSLLTTVALALVSTVLTLPAALSMWAVHGCDQPHGAAE